jgi:hypothetical protein
MMARWRPARARGWLPWLVLTLLTLAATAQAATLTIDAGDDPDARLELRRTVLPSGVEVELVVLTGRHITLTIDDVVIVGQRIELDVGGRIVRVIGPGSFATGSERLEGLDLELRLDDEQVRAIDAVVFTSAIDVTGDLAERVPGQVSFAGGLASPCTRCGQEVLDYAFRAERMVLYPGDRLVGHDVTLLVRGVAVLRLPLLVIPLAQGDRQPRLAIATGTAVRRAEVSLRWPYVAGRDALGTFTVRYLADVDPTEDAGLLGRLLGGPVEVSYLGFELDHRVYDEDGAGGLFVAYEPNRLGRAATPGVPARAPVAARWTVRLAYATAEGGLGTTVRADLTRDDARTAGRWVYQFGLSATDPTSLGALGVRLHVDSQGFVDTDPAIGPRTPPAYADRRTPLRTPLRLRFEPLDVAPLQLGRLRVTGLALDLGMFQDYANPIHRRAAAAGLVAAGRALIGHQLVLDAWAPWAGVRFEGDNRFEGRYYGSDERAVAWRTRFGVTQNVGSWATLAATLTRDVVEGETPFRFDAAAVRSRTDLQFRVSLRPAAWVGVESSGGYVFVENRRPETVGWAPLTTRLTLFGDRPWIDASLEHIWQIRDDDPGSLRAALTLQARPIPVELRVTLEHLQDLRPDPATPLVADTVTRLTGRAAYDRVVALDVTAAYRPAPAPDAAGRLRYVEPIDVRLALGSLRSGDARPGVRLQSLFDAEEARVERLTVDLRARAGAVELEARQRIDLPAGRVSDASVIVTWEDVARLEARGVAWLPPAWLGHAEEPRLRQLSVQLREERRLGPPRWEATWQSTVDPAVAAPGRRDTRFEVRAALLQEVYGPWLVSVEAQAEWALRDALQPESFLRRLSWVVGADAWERIGVQGRIGYQATYDRFTGALVRRELTIDDLTLAVRPTDALTVGARLRDVWELTGRDAGRSPWTIRPEVFFVWDRCCWALSGAWNAATGSVRIVLTGPGASTGLEQVLETGWSLPRTALRGTP